MGKLFDRLGTLGVALILLGIHAKWGGGAVALLALGWLFLGTTIAYGATWVPRIWDPLTTVSREVLEKHRVARGSENTPGWVIFLFLSIYGPFALIGVYRAWAGKIRTDSRGEEKAHKRG